jgi:hypothetical protein
MAMKEMSGRGIFFIDYFGTETRASMGAVAW